MSTQNNINYSQSSNHSSGIDSILNTPIPKIKVIIRKRPLNSKEAIKGEIDIISIKDNSKVIVSEQKVGLDLTKYIDKKEFIFDNAYDETSNNESIYIQNIRPMIFNAFYFKSKITCFAYGQTGSGKTFTMMGAPQGGQGGNNGNNAQNSGSANLGMYMLAGYDIFNILANEAKFNGFKILISFYEIYCDKLYDLLNNKNKLETREDKKHNINIVGLSENNVNSLNELMTIINFGLKQRTVGKTGANSDSSRSHGIIQIRIMNTNNKEHGKITFIDLAGSEREVDKVNINKKTRIDGAEINKSLLALKECIRALDQEKSHTPFRGSKLTIVLRDSFIGDCKILMIANISPGNNSSDHTLNTLRYADRVKELKKNSNYKNNNKNKNDNNNNKNCQSQVIGNLLNKKNENKNENILDSNFKNGSKFNYYKGAGAEKKRRNSSSSSLDSFDNKLKKNNKNQNKVLKSKISFNAINNYTPFQNNQITNSNNNNSPHDLFTGNFYDPFSNNNNLSINTNFNNFLNRNYSQTEPNDIDIDLNEDKKINNLFINNNNTNINSYSLSFNKKENVNNIDENNINQSFCSSSNVGYNGLSLSELQNKYDNIVKSIAYQEALCKEKQQMHINTLCESLKTEMGIFQQYQKKELLINTYIDSIQNLFRNQTSQINEMSNNLENLKGLINQQAQISKLIDEIKNGKNNLVNSLFDNQMNNLNY